MRKMKLEELSALTGESFGVQTRIRSLFLTFCFVIQVALSFSYPAVSSLFFWPVFFFLSSLHKIPFAFIHKAAPLTRTFARWLYVPNTSLVWKGWFSTERGTLVAVTIFSESCWEIRWDWTQPQLLARWWAFPTALLNEDVSCSCCCVAMLNSDPAELSDFLSLLGGALRKESWGLKSLLDCTST